MWQIGNKGSGVVTQQNIFDTDNMWKKLEHIFTCNDLIKTK